MAKMLPKNGGNQSKHLPSLKLKPITLLLTILTSKSKLDENLGKKNFWKMWVKTTELGRLFSKV